MIKTLKSQSGITLILALLTMAALSAVAVAISVLIMNEILGTRGINYSVTSFYAAETGIEKGLWNIREQRRLGTSIEETAIMFDGASETLSDSRVKWEIEVNSEQQQITTNLRQDESAFFDIYNPNDPALLPTEMALTFDECAPGPTEIEASWTGWTSTTGFLNYSTKTFPVDCNPGVFFQLDPEDDNPEHIRLQLRAFNGAATNVTFTVYDQNDAQIALASTIQITAVGRYPEGTALSAVQAIRAKVPWVLPISGIYTYVVYSEESLSK